ncbi:aerotaxis receptor [Streptosporangium becharense]|uniref:Aerotaxis receptor n=1 Tax=Streptosporangium becharense TaxID=1816182 RepID=A0A7W9IGC3_9ACTN|nr:PAS domain-containing protein [Streptosporangium becharense]MBB2908824.1 aerotaxis receptor [Streptosporangium becharense]MBB5820158.1 aerotaxis receptor [Streptosporangium becharense]
MSLSELTVPGGVEQVIGADELFFSTTDRRGLIRSGNSVFVRTSRFSLDELTGAPHNIVRHPDMPAGVFRLMWDRLLTGRPAGAYVQNLAKDGSRYWVFATMTPLAEGFLSVRMAPRADLFDAVKQTYRYVTDAELDAARRGANRGQVALAGMQRLEELLDELGFGSHDDFLTEALTAEIAARGRLASATYARPSARGPIAGVLAGAGALETQLADLVERLEGYRVFSDRLVRSSAQVLAVARRLNHTVAAAQAASEMVADTTPVLRNVARVMATPTDAAVTALEQLVPRLATLRADVTDLRFRIALGNLHNNMVAAFAAEVVDGVAPPTSLNEVPLLCDAVHENVLEMSARAQQVNQALHEIIAGVAEAGERLAGFSRFLGQWRILVLRHRAGGTLGNLVQPIDEEFAASWDGMEMLRALGKEFESFAVPFDVRALEEQVTRIRAEAAESRYTF